MSKRLVQVALPSPLYRLFDYFWPSAQPIVRGARVLVPFGQRRLVGIVLQELTESDVPYARLRNVAKVLDSVPVLPEEILSALCWASRYYHHPLGDVLSSALPTLLRKGRPALLQEREQWRLLPEVAIAASEHDQHRATVRGPVQTALLARLANANGETVDASELAAISTRWRASIKPLLDRQLVSCEHSLALPSNVASDTGPQLLEEQQQAVDAIVASLRSFQPHLLHGVTGSGKTEVYLRCIEAARQQGMQVLVLVPEISLTPQLMQRFTQRLNGCLVSLHSGLNDSERLQNWLLAANGYADIVIGTRSAVLVPMPRLGLVLIDEEHDGSLKQQDGFRYHARDFALLRARNRQCPVVLGSATPSFESLHNVTRKRYQYLPLNRRAGEAMPPELALLDIRRRPLTEGISDRLMDAIRTHLDNDGQVLVFINRRGFAPTLLCNDCGAAADCRRCDAHMTVHARSNRLRCHHCGAERPLPVTCEQCSSENLDRIGHGTERIAAALTAEFPDIAIARIDRDSTRRKGALEKQLALAVSGEARLLVGTQMLAKGHHFPKLTLVGILDADRGLFGTDFRSLEHMGQLTIQVAGRAGREQRRGTVLIQTRNPDNPMLQTLVEEGYDAFARIALADRQLAELPPFAYVALVRAEASDAESSITFLRQVAELLQQPDTETLHVLGPAPAPMERVAGRYRAQLLLQADKRSTLNNSLSWLTVNIGDLSGVRRTRWSIDVDPVDLY
ncbi:MAG: primosomal protein N' [Granulosicoccus sp.]